MDHRLNPVAKYSWFLVHWRDFKPYFNDTVLNLPNNSKLLGWKTFYARRINLKYLRINSSLYLGGTYTSKIII